MLKICSDECPLIMSSANLTFGKLSCGASFFLFRPLWNVKVQTRSSKVKYYWNGSLPFICCVRIFSSNFLEFHCLFLSLFWEDIHYFKYSWVLIKSCCVISPAAGFLWNRLCVLPICGHPISFCANHWESFCLNKHFGFGLIIIGTKKDKKEQRSWHLIQVLKKICSFIKLECLFYIWQHFCRIWCSTAQWQ